MKYDSNGLRIQKGNKIFYWYNGNLVLECWKENETEKFIYYNYDESGVCGMHFESQDYFFEKMKPEEIYLKPHINCFQFLILLQYNIFLIL